MRRSVTGAGNRAARRSVNLKGLHWRPAVGSSGERWPPDRAERQDAAAGDRPRAGRRLPQGDRAVRGARAVPRAHPHLPPDPARPLERPRGRATTPSRSSTPCWSTAGTPSRTRCSSTSPRPWPATGGCGWRSTPRTGWCWSAPTARCSRRSFGPRRSPACSATGSTTTRSWCTPPNAATSSRRCSSWAGPPRTSPATSTARRTRSPSTRRSGTLRDYQRDAAESFWHGGSGVVVLPCGAGKTLVGAAAMAQAQATTLILVTNTVSARQWKDELVRRTSLTADEIGEYSGAVKEIRPVTIATYQVMTTRRKGVYTHLELLDARDWGLIVYDEVHLLPAPIFRMTANLQARRRIGLTATLVREDGREGDVFSLIGPKRYDAPWKDIEAQGWIAPADCVEVRVDPALGRAARLRHGRAGRAVPAGVLHPPQDRRRARPGRPAPGPADAGDRAVHRPARRARRGPRCPGDQGRDAGAGAAAALRGVPDRRGRAAGRLQGRELLHRPALGRGRDPGVRARSAPARRRPSGSAGCCGPSPRARPRTSTRSSPATPSTPSSPRTGSGSSPSRATPTGSWTPRTCRPDSTGTRVSGMKSAGWRGTLEA